MIAILTFENELEFSIWYCQNKLEFLILVSPKSAMICENEGLHLHLRIKFKILIIGYPMSQAGQNGTPYDFKGFMVVV
jgi:hypothetical protein